MPSNTLNAQRTESLQRHLHENGSECIRHNMVVYIDLINADGTVAYCPVEQRHSGLLRHHYTIPELIWRAHQALASLMGSGLVPLITVRHESLLNAIPLPPGRARRTRMDWIPDLWRWLGYPPSPTGLTAVPAVNAPSGRRKVLLASGTA